jgi:hypothetical protein
MLELQRHVCATLDIDPRGLHQYPASQVMFDRWKTWHLATIAELIEALDETGWKRHTTSDRFDGEKAFGELRDALQFLIDLMFLATGLSAEELADKLVEALERKSAVNLARKAGGDDGVARRCPRCGRSMDEPGTPLRLCRVGWCGDDVVGGYYEPVGIR